MQLRCISKKHFLHSLVIVFTVALLAACVKPRVYGIPQQEFGKSDVETIQEDFITPAHPDVLRAEEPDYNASAVVVAQRIRDDLTRPTEDTYADASDDDEMASDNAASDDINMLDVHNHIAGMKETSDAEDAAMDKDESDDEENVIVRPTAKIALLLPLSGQSASLARSFQNSAEMALFDVKDKANITLVPIDTRGTESGALIAVQKAIDEQVDIIIGPLFSNTSAAVIDLAQARNIEVISFSNDIRLKNTELFLFGFNPQEQVRRVAQYAYSQKIRKFSNLLPDNDYGIIIIDELNEVLKRRNIGIKRAEYYDEANEKLSQAINRLTFLDPSQPKPTAKSEALLIPEGGRMLLTIAARLNRKGIVSDHLRYLGTSDWDDSQILREPYLSGSWFATYEPSLQSDFYKRFRKSYGYEPLRDATVAYDAVMMITQLAALDRPDKFSDEALSRIEGFGGFAGIFRFDESGIAQRALAVVEVNKGRLRVLDPAPTIFPSSFGQTFR